MVVGAILVFPDCFLASLLCLSLSLPAIVLSCSASSSVCVSVCWFTILGGGGMLAAFLFASSVAMSCRGRGVGGCLMLGYRRQVRRVASSMPCIMHDIVAWSTSVCLFVVFVHRCIGIDSVFLISRHSCRYLARAIVASLVVGVSSHAYSLYSSGIGSSISGSEGASISRPSCSVMFHFIFSLAWLYRGHSRHM